MILITINIKDMLALGECSVVILNSHVLDIYVSALSALAVLASCHLQCSENVITSIDLLSVCSVCCNVLGLVYFINFILMFGSGWVLTWFPWLEFGSLFDEGVISLILMCLCLIYYLLSAQCAGFRLMSIETNVHWSPNTLMSIPAPPSFSRLHLLRWMQTLPAGDWFHLSHCINPPGTEQEVVAGHLDATRSFSPSLFFLLSWPLVFPRLFNRRKLRLSEYEWTWPSVPTRTHTHTHTDPPSHVHHDSIGGGGVSYHIFLWNV